MDTKTVDIPPLPKATWIVDRQGMLGVIYIAFCGKGFFFPCRYLRVRGIDTLSV
jgi:hypothetical protein